MRDADQHPERLHFACDWFDPKLDVSCRAFRDLHSDCPADPTAWPPAVANWLAAHDAALSLLDLLLLPHDADGRPQGAIALLAERKQQDSSDLPFKLRTSATEDLLRSAWYMLEPHRRVFEQATLDRLSEVAPGGLSAVLECAAQLVKESTDADQVFLQYRQELIATPWHGDAPRGGGESSLTQLAKSDGAVMRVLDASDTERSNSKSINREALAELLAVLQWEELRSAIVCPIGDGAGLIKVLTRDQGTFLTSADAQLVSSIASHIDQIAGRTMRGTMLQGLNELASRVAGLSGQKLASSLVKELEDWSKAFIRPNCHVLVLAKDAHGSVDSRRHLSRCHGAAARAIECRRARLAAHLDTSQLRDRARPAAGPRPRPDRRRVPRQSSAPSEVRKRLPAPGWTRPQSARACRFDADCCPGSRRSW